MKQSRHFLIAVLTMGLSFSALPQKDPHKTMEGLSDLSQFLASVKDYPLPGSAKRIDYQSVDENGSLLFIAHLGDNSVTIFDLKPSAVVRNIRDIPKPYCILAVPKLNKVYVSATGVDEIFVLDEVSLNIIDKVPAGHYPD